MNILGEKLRLVREKTNMTQQKVAMFLGVDQSLVSKVEKGERALSVTQLEKLSNLYGCPVSYFETVEEEFEPTPIAFRATSISVEDLEAIAAVNRIIKDMQFVDGLLEGVDLGETKVRA